MTWLRCVDKTLNFKVQIINNRLQAQLIENMLSRDKDFEFDIEKSTLPDSVTFELGGYGIYATSQPRISFNLIDTVLTIDCGQISAWIEKLKKSKIRVFSDGTKYIKIHARFSCLILTQDERESLIFQMTGKEKEASLAADEFFGNLKKLWNTNKVKHKKKSTQLYDTNKNVSIIKNKKDPLLFLTKKPEDD